MVMKWRFSPLLPAVKGPVTVGSQDVDVGCSYRRQYGMGLAVGIYVLGAVGLFAALLSPTYVRPPT
jgi:hypothetical protein